MTHFEFASCVPFAEESSSSNLLNGRSPRQGVLFRAANSEAPEMSLINEIESLLQLDAHSGLRYADNKRSHLRSIKLDRRNALPQLEAFVMAGDTSAETWLKNLLQTQQSTESYGRRLLMTGQTPPITMKSVGHTICTCVGVKDLAIEEWLMSNPGEESVQLEGLKINLKCGTECGSCVPQLKRIINLKVSFTEKSANPSLVIKSMVI
jgi:assimilatory nitrate reductase catalytic subunit